MRANQELLTTLSIQRINDAVLVMKHFIELSNKLLPILNDLQQKPSRDKADLQKIDRIIEVYKNHSFDPATSDVLINSPILSMVRDSFNALSNPNFTAEDRNNKILSLQNEYKRLQDNWNYASLN